VPECAALVQVCRTALRNIVGTMELAELLGASAVTTLCGAALCSRGTVLAPYAIFAFEKQRLIFGIKRLSCAVKWQSDITPRCSVRPSQRAARCAQSSQRIARPSATR
jgi:hypothetical protein